MVKDDLVFLTLLPSSVSCLDYNYIPHLVCGMLKPGLPECLTNTVLFELLSVPSYDFHLHSLIFLNGS